MVAELASDGGRIADGIVSRDLRRPAGGEKQSREDAQERGFSCAIRAEQRHGFAVFYLKADIPQRGRSLGRERLKEGAPARVDRREKLVQGVDGDGVVGHSRVYNVSAARKQCGEHEGIQR